MIKRAIYKNIKEHLDTPHIFTLIIGPRQAGKTTLMNILMDDLQVAGHKCVNFNIDISGHKDYFTSHEALVAAIKLSIGDIGYVFLDEIQRKQDAGLFLKGLYDMNLPYKFVVTGSGSLELKEKIHESLPGRKRMFELSTLSFDEFAHYKTNYKFEPQNANSATIEDFFKQNPNQATEILHEYLNFGGYPRVAIAQTAKQKQVEIDDIYKSYLERDVNQMNLVQKVDRFASLVRVLAAQSGNITNITELSNTLGITHETVMQYLWYLEKTYIIKKVSPFYTNIRSEITKSPVYYFVDLGLKNYSINQFGTASSLLPPPGMLFENFVYNILYQKYYSTPVILNFWRTQDAAEVDFVLSDGLRQMPVEVKFSTLTRPQITRSFGSFINKYEPKVGYVVHMGSYFEQKYQNTTVHFLPYYMLGAEDIFAQA